MSRESIHIRGLCGKSSGSIGDVLVMTYNERVFIRNAGSGDPSSVSFTREQWSKFLSGVKAGEFDIVEQSRCSGERRPQHYLIGPTQCACGATIPETDNVCPVGGVEIS